MANIGNYTYLEYTIVPSPLIVNEKQDIIILATLKTSVENQGELDSVHIDNILLDFGSTGSAATELVTVANAITQSHIVHEDKNWSFEEGGKGMSFKVTPSSLNLHQGRITTNTIMIKITDVLVNDAPGNATITITETVSKVNGSLLTTGNINQASLVLPKIQSDDSEVTFSASPEYVQAGKKTVLSWNAPHETSASFSLQYLSQGKLIKISEHQDGSKLSAADQYPKEGDPDLILSETTNFILGIRSDGHLRNISLPIIVSQADIYAQEATIPNYQGGNFSFKDGEETLLNIDGQGNSTTITINTDQGTNSWTKLVLQNKSSSWTIGTSRDFQGNELYIYNDKGAGTAISEHGNLNVNGNISNQGQGGKTFLGTLSEANAYTAPSLFKGPGAYRRYELIFNGVKVPADMPNLFFGARLYVENAAQQPYCDMVYFSERIGDSEGHCDSFMRLWYNALTSSNNTGIIGSLTLFAHQSLAYYAHTYAPAPGFIDAGRQCLMSGGLNTTPNLPLEGIEIAFYHVIPSFSGITTNKVMIKEGSIDVYGWS